MKKLLALVCCLLSLNLWAIQAGDRGVGVMLGNPTGLTGKYWLSETEAVDAGLGMSLGRGSRVNIHSDYLLHRQGAFYFNDTYPLDLYYGIGGRMRFADDIELGVRVPVGLTHHLSDQPADLFAEIAPVLDLINRVGLDLQLAVGARYYF